MTRDCKYDAKVTLIDIETHGRDWVQEGRADKVLIDAIKFISRKDSKANLYQRISNFLLDDFKEFDRIMSNFLFKKK